MIEIMLFVCYQRVNFPCGPAAACAGGGTPVNEPGVRTTKPCKYRCRLPSLAEAEFCRAR